MFFHAVVMAVKCKSVLIEKKMQLMYFPKHCYLEVQCALLYEVQNGQDVAFNNVNTFFF